VNRSVTAFEVGCSLAADLVLKFAERDMSSNDRDELVKYAADIADRLITMIIRTPQAENITQETPTP
jgi:Mg2+ and Co2+ transporter CorA